MEDKLFNKLPLNLPSFNYTLKQVLGKVYILDVVYKKYLVLSPEEWVRQHMLNYLIYHLAYPKGLCCSERKIERTTGYYRPDIVLRNPKGQANMIVECKAPYLKITYKTLGQILQYHRYLTAEFLVLTNGMVHFCWQLTQPSNQFKAIKYIPSYEELKKIMDSNQEL
ncbi:MAG: type I restriction enzyme HsdR N-terminal domain-containing protein [Amoebophilaceae bacterium]|nr:type I restriction enzyme HsdR N-terminal domain-containing protein [Amoebophilaceae bacterium]